MRPNGSFMARFKTYSLLLLLSSFEHSCNLEGFFVHLLWHCYYEFLKFSISLMAEGFVHNLMPRTFVFLWSWTAQQKFGCTLPGQKVIKCHRTTLICSITTKKCIIILQGCQQFSMYIKAVALKWPPSQPQGKIVHVVAVCKKPVYEKRKVGC